MNGTRKKTFLSFFPVGVLLSRKKLSLGRNAHPKLFHQQVTNSCQPSVLKNSGVLATLGQPTHLTHPHRIKKGEIVPGICTQEFQLRRERLLENIKSYCKHHDLTNKTLLIVIPSSYKKYMTEKIPYVFRQNSDFLYLTGCMEQDSILVVMAEGNKHENIIFVRGRDPQSEMWDGPRTGVEQAAELFGVDKAMPVKEFAVFFESFLKDTKECMVWYDFVNNIHPTIHKIMHQYLAGTGSKVWESPRRFIHQLRLFKSPAEQELMKKSCQVASLAIKETIMDSQPWDNEAFIQARVDFNCRMKGAEYLAYPPVVASGDRTNIIHYIDNNQVVEDGDLVLMDAGCEFHGYCSDITRTWPISGKFSAAQRILYEAVYSVQVDLIESCCKFPTLDDLYLLMIELLGKKLRDAGILANGLHNIDRYVQQLCPHHVSHYLGMDVHDTATVFRNVPLQPGMVCTIEPGVYISKGNKFTNTEFHGIGVRIEDDILMTESGPLVLTASCPKHINDIENLKLS